mmetsp:Transcript_4395/g.7477  ORF Transcript_4395/g.7477 Transcript_4395/m.7477 type:complete len:176 (+) Transcript_4395:132-659(+)
MSHFPEIVSKEPERRKSFENSIQPSRENVNRSRASFEAVPSNLRTYAVQSFGLSNGELGVISSSRKSIAKLDELLRKASRSSQGREPINRSREQIFDQSSESECPIWLTTCGIRSKALTRYRPQNSSDGNLFMELGPIPDRLVRVTSIQLQLPRRCNHEQNRVTYIFHTHTDQTF